MPGSSTSMCRLSHCAVVAQVVVCWAVLRVAALQGRPSEPLVEGIFPLELTASDSIPKKLF